jgi:glycosyltransferase involved in cell wall biosynthesis
MTLREFVPAITQERPSRTNSDAARNSGDFLLKSPAGDAYQVSVVVPTHNRSALLARTLDSLMGQTGGIRYEIVVVDNNSQDDTRTLVEGYTAAASNIRYLFEGRPGVSHARNTGVANARADLIAFIDDDVEAEPTWLAEIVRALEAHPDVDCVGGAIRARWSEPPPRWLTPFHWGALALQREKGPSPYVDADNASPCLMTANFACRRAAFVEVGGFSAAFLRDEDRELQLRLWEAGKRGLYVNDIVVTTEVPRDRLRKRYHRKFHSRVGASHARMRYLDRLHHDGRLIREPAVRLTVLGTPGFLYRSLANHLWGWFRSAVTGQWDRAFFHETRIRYITGYVRERARHRGRSRIAAEMRQMLAYLRRAWAVRRSRAGVGA